MRCSVVTIIPGQREVGACRTRIVAGTDAPAGHPLPRVVIGRWRLLSDDALFGRSGGALQVVNISRSKEMGPLAAEGSAKDIDSIWSLGPGWSILK